MTTIETFSTHRLLSLENCLPRNVQLGSAALQSTAWPPMSTTASTAPLARFRGGIAVIVFVYIFTQDCNRHGGIFFFFSFFCGTLFCPRGTAGQRVQFRDCPARCGTGGHPEYLVTLGSGRISPVMGEVGGVGRPGGGGE